jgi:hypothetical protein
MPDWTCSSCGDVATRACPACFTTLCPACAKLDSHDIPAGKHVGQRCLGYAELDRSTEARLMFEARLATKVAKPWDLKGFVKVERRSSHKAA